MRTSLVIAALLAVSPAALAADLKVGKGKQFTTIQAAVAAAQDGDRILVGPGVYRENVTLSGVSNVQLIGKGAVWDGHTGGGYGDCLSGTANGILVQGFRFRHGSDHVVIAGNGGRITKCVSRGAGSTAFAVSGSGWRIDACQVVGASSSSIEVDGANAIVEGNRIRNGDGGAIYVNGASARVAKNSIRTIEDDIGVDVSGDDAVVEANAIWNTDDENIYVSGNRARVVANKCSYTSDGPGITVEGDSMEVASNTVVAAAEGGLELTGDAVSVHDNVVNMTTEGEPGIRLSARSSSGGGTLARNVVSDTTDWGFDLESSNLTLSGNSALRCGPGYAGGFHVVGVSNTVESCVAASSRATGFLIEGDGAIVTNSSATGGSGDGFRISGSAPQLTNLTATGNGGEGLDNRGVSTRAQGCTLAGNRIDVACDVGNGASFDGGLAGNTFTTGGPTTAPEIDN